MEAVFLVCYDIADPKRLRQVHKSTEDRGARVQYSVYLCALSPLQVVAFQADLLDIIEPSEDRVLFVRLGPRNPVTYDKMESLGQAFQPLEHRSCVV
jgi:CRISPR-associated protein Cas2